MTIYTPYNLITGEFLHYTVEVSDDQIEGNTPSGYALIEGKFKKNQRFDISQSKVVDFDTESPGSDYVFDTLLGDWVLSSAAIESIYTDKQARAKIKELEESGIRALREAALGKPGAAQRLEQIDSQIEALRLKIKVT